MIFHILLPLYEVDKCSDLIPFHYQDTVVFIDPIARQAFDDATWFSCDNNPQALIALDLDFFEHYVLTLKCNMSYSKVR